MREFNVGQVVTWAPDMFIRHAAPGDYKIIAAMPDRDGDRMYRIKSPLEEYERVVQESLLTKSDGYLPDEAPPQKVCGKSITLPKLSGVLPLEYPSPAKRHIR
jgi:hypothetical protein